MVKLNFLKMNKLAVITDKWCRKDEHGCFATKVKSKELQIKLWHTFQIHKINLNILTKKSQIIYFKPIIRMLDLESCPYGLYMNSNHSYKDMISI